MKNRNSIPAYIIILIIFLWPVGLFLLYNHLTSDKTAVIKNATISRNYGVVLLIIGLLVCAMSPSARFETGESALLVFLAMGLFVFLGGLALLVYAAKQKRIGQLYEKYVSLIVVYQVRSLDEIARAMQLDYEQVVSDLKKMIGLGFFMQAYVDEFGRNLVLQNPYAQQLVAVPCRNCGAVSRAYANTVSYCEYCRAPLQ